MATISKGSSRKQRCYPKIESTYGTIETVANGDACLISSLVTTPAQDIIQRPDKTGNSSQVVGISGRRIGNWSTRMSLAGSGAAGTAPDIDPFLYATFGKAGVVVTSTSVTYSLDDASPGLTIFNHRTPATLTQMVAFGAIVQSMRVDFGGDVAEVEFSGLAKWVLDSVEMLTIVNGDEGKGGLTGTSFPTEPAAPTTNGTMARGFIGVVTLDSQIHVNVRSGSIQFNTGRDLTSKFDSYYRGDPIQDMREVLIDLELDDSDDTNLNDLKAHARSQSTIDMSIQIGKTTGNIWTFSLNDVVLPAGDYDDGQPQWGFRFSGARAHATSLTAKDELTLVCT